MGKGEASKTDSFLERYLDDVSLKGEWININEGDTFEILFNYDIYDNDKNFYTIKLDRTNQITIYPKKSTTLLKSKTEPFKLW